MSISELISNLSLEDIEKLKILKLEELGEVPTYSFSNISFRELKNLVDIEQKIDKGNFDSWFNSEISISDEVESFLQKLIDKNKPLMKYYKEEDLKLHFLSHIFGKINFTSYENSFRDFYNENLKYETPNFILNGETDFLLASGLFESKTPYFFIQEFKKEKVNKDPEPQLLAEMIAGLENSQVTYFKGSFIVGAIWNFVILKKIGEHKYDYYVSENFDSTKIEDLKSIYKNLLFIKKEIISKTANF